MSNAFIFFLKLEQELTGLENFKCFFSQYFFYDRKIHFINLNSPKHYAV